MVQVYFALVVCNLISGLVLVRPGWKRPLGTFEGWFQPFEHRTVKGVLGLFSFLSGFLGLIFVLPGDQIFLGDLLPSITSLLAGTIFVIEFYQKPEPEAPKKRIEDFLVSNRILVGLLCLVFGLIHFFSPAVIFL